MMYDINIILTVEGVMGEGSGASTGRFVAAVKVNKMND